MKIAVVSDTHWQPGGKLPRVLELIEQEKPDLILHAGDWTSLQLWGYLSRIARCEGVAGNCDDAALVAELGLMRRVPAEDTFVGLTHGHLFGQNAAQCARLAVNMAFADKSVGALVFGHSHVPMNEVVDGVLLFNPGSAQRPLGEVKRPSYGILTVSGSDITGEIKYFDK